MTNARGLPSLDNNNDGADYWRYQIGVNAIPVDTQNKKPIVEWAQYQDNPVPEWQHEKWKSENAFSKGMAIVPGKVWHNPDRTEYYLVFIDLDNLKAINEVAIHGLENLVG